VIEAMKASDLRPSTILIKRALGKGEVVTRERQTGKTTALLEFVHEHDPGNVIIVVCNGMTRDWTKDRYRKLFPQDPQPIVKSIQTLNEADLMGTRRRWCTDEVWPRAVTNRCRAYEFAPYLGGVGTPMCMVDFSDAYLTGAEGEVPENPKPVFAQVSDGRKRRAKP